MLASSQSLKSQANTLFTRQEYVSAISTYDRALAELPRYLDYDMAVLQSNIAACHLKMEQWKDAVEACERGIESLEREMPTKAKQRDKDVKKRARSGWDKEGQKETNAGKESMKFNSDTESEPSSPVHRPEAEDGKRDDTVVELPSDDDDAATALSKLNISDDRKADITRIRVKLLLRRARARSSMPPSSSFSPSSTSKDKDAKDSSGSTWSNLGSALEDYKLLQSTPQYWECLPASDRKTVRQALVELPPKVEEAKQREVGEMMGKLKDLGNTVLKPFGLSTENFKMVQGEGGGYSLSFDGGKKG